MASYIVIEFDRTAPEIEMFAPSYTTNEITTVITIEANESMSSYQEFYAIDNLGNRHIYTFHQEDPNTYIGRIRFNTVPLGLVNLYARVKDEVDNISDVAMATIEVKEHNQLLKLSTKHAARNVRTGHGNYGTILPILRDTEIKVDDRTMETDTAETVRRIDTSNQDREG